MAAGEVVGSDGGGGGNILAASAPPLPRASVKSLQKESYGRKKSYFPPRVGNIPVEAGKNPCPKKWTIDVGTVVS